LITWIAATYAALLILIVPLTTHATSLSVHTAFAGASGLYLLLLGLTSFGWKYLWKYVPKLNQWLFPLLDGKWDMTIHWQSNGGSGTVVAEATIKQSFLKISMEVTSNDSDSETLIAHPKKDAESGTSLLYYVYRVTPRLTSGQAGGPNYLGSAILKFYPSDQVAELRGNYFTSANTQGHFELSRADS
jgi:hypothetical protein